MKVAEKLIILPKKKDNKYKFQAIILEENYSKNSYNGKILGRKLADWVAFACNDIPVKKNKYDGKTSILDYVKSIIDNSYDYTCHDCNACAIIFAITHIIHPQFQYMFYLIEE